MKRLYFIVVAALFFIACEKKDSAIAGQSEAVDKEVVRAEIKLLETKFADAINNKSLEGIANYYADDAESYLTGSEVLVGKAAILKSTSADFKGMKEKDKVEYTMTDLFIANDGNQAVEMGSYRATNSNGVLERKGNFMAVFAKRNGKFRCVRDIDCPQ